MQAVPLGRVCAVSQVVTGEAVVLSVRVASMPARALALLIDLAVQGPVLVVATVLAVSGGSQVDSALAAALYILVTALVVLGYPVAFETATRGRSLGKMAMGLRVVSSDGGPERFRQALFRGLAGLIEIWATSGVLALVSSLVSSRGRRLGDVFAGTIVIGERGPKETPPPAMPPALEMWARSLELSRLPDEVANAARHYLTRMYDLRPDIQHSMGLRIATQVAACVTPPPPPNVPAHMYLAAVLAERRRRAELRHARHAPPQLHHEPPPRAAGERPADNTTGRGFSPPG
jgi:uncharacterized RDD family membrane protein YckC